MHRRTLVLGFCLAILFNGPAFGQSEQAKQLMARGNAFLKGKLATDERIGYLALGTLAILKSQNNAMADPAVKALVDKVAASVPNEGFTQRDNNASNYDAAVVIMCLVAADNPELYFPYIKTAAEFLISKQEESGAWDYRSQYKDFGDTSMTQYAILALWDAGSVGVAIPPQVWDNALSWFAKTQQPSGGFMYHPGSPDKNWEVETRHTMTAAAAGSAFICQSQLPSAQGGRKKGEEKKDLLTLVRLDNQGAAKQAAFKPKVTAGIANGLLDRAETWLRQNFTIDKPSGPHHYYLYGLERYATFVNVEKIAGRDWYAEGVDWLAKDQKSDGSWAGEHQDVADTAFSVLFLARSTKKSVERILNIQMGAGTLSAGYGVPTSDVPSDFEARRKEKYKNYYKTPVDELLKSIQSADIMELEKAAVGLELADSEEILRATKGSTKQLRALAKSPIAKVRVGALWALARTKDYRVVPVIIHALADADAEVYGTARDCLRYLSRRIDAFGLPEKKPDDKSVIAKAQQQWTDWYQQLRVEVSPDQEFDETLD